MSHSILIIFIFVTNFAFWANATSTDELMTTCEANYVRNVSVTDGVDQITGLPIISADATNCMNQYNNDQPHIDACIAQNQVMNEGGQTVFSFCKEQVRATCGGADVLFQDNKIAGCSQFGHGNQSDTNAINPFATPAKAKPSVAAAGGAIAGGAAKAAGKASTTQSGSQTSGADPTQSEVNADIQSCQSGQSNASSCCNNPSSCNGGLTTTPTPSSDSAQGMNDYCKQMQQASLANATANNNAASACHSKYSDCQNTCDGLVSKYQTLASKDQMYSDAVNKLQNVSKTCGGYSKVVAQLAQQGGASADSSGAGYQCNQKSSINPSSLGGLGDMGSQQSSDPYGCATDPTSVACTGCQSNPSSPECRALAAASQTKTTSTAGFMDSKKNGGAPQFNVPDATPSGVGDQFSAGAAGGNKGSPSSASVVANNSGGSIPNSGSKGASLDANGKQKPPGPTAPSSVADILHSERGGSGYSQPTGGSGGDDNGLAGAGGYGRGTGVGRGLAGVNGLDLKRYLPGGALDPNRRAGGLNAGGREIIGRFEDMWKNVSVRYVEKCRLGVLMDCR